MNDLDDISKNIITIAFQNYAQVPSFLLRVCNPQVFTPLIADVRHDLSLLGISIDANGVQEDLAAILQRCSFQENTDQSLITALKNEFGLYLASARRNSILQQARRDQLNVPRGMAVPSRPMSNMHKKLDLQMSRPNVPRTDKKDYSLTADRGVLDRNTADHTLDAAKTVIDFDKRQVFHFDEKAAKLDEMTKIIGKKSFHL